MQLATLLFIGLFGYSFGGECEQSYGGKCLQWGSTCPRKPNGSAGSFFGGCGSFLQICCTTLNTQPPPTTRPDVGTSTAKCGVSQPGWRIISGSTSSAGQWPWQVSLYFQGSHACGGTLIDEDTILTAAHCFGMPGGASSYNWKVVVGEVNIRRPRKFYTVKSIQQHAYFRDFQGNDVAIITLNERVALNSNQLPACLPSHNPSTGDTCYVTGFGQTIPDRMDVLPSFKLLHVDVDIIDTRTCARIYQGSAVDSRTVCAGGHTSKNACRGDSGGPLVCKKGDTWYIHGIVSFGNFPCGQYANPGVYTRVSAYLDWIKARM